VCYVLDEPTIGLHSRDNERLLDTVTALAARGNTVVVVEHDEDTIRRAEHIVDLGPGAGRNGGEVVVNGTLADLLASERSTTGRVLASPPRHPLQPRRAVVGDGGTLLNGHGWLELKRVTRHNLRALDAANADAILIEAPPDDAAWLAVRDRLTRAAQGEDDDRD